MSLQSQKTQAQSANKQTSNDPPFGVGTSSTMIGAGWGVDYDYYGSAKSLPTFNLIHDKAKIDKVGPGIISFGWAFAAKIATYEYSSAEAASWLNLILGFRATYHLTILKDVDKHFDPYAGIFVGVRYLNYSDNYLHLSTSNGDVKSFYPVYGLFVGAKYNFTKGFGVFGEFGFDYNNLRLGLNFNHTRHHKK